MKKTFLHILILLLAAPAVFCAFALFFGGDGEYAYAESAEEIEKELEGEVDKNLSGLDLSGFEAFYAELDKLFSLNGGTSIRSVIDGILKNQSQFDVGTMMKLLFSSMLKEMVSALPAMISIIIIAVLYGLLKGLTSGFAKESTSQIVYFVCYGAILSIISYSIIKNVIYAQNAVKNTAKLLDIVFPILLTLTAAMGGAGSAAVYQPMMTVLTTVMIKIINGVIFPLFFAALVFSIIGNLTDNVKLDKLTKTTKSLAEWTLGIMFSVFIIFVTAQGITGAAYDTVAVKATKFALSSYVPILGGYLSEGFDLVMASCVLIKNAVGLTAVIVLFMTIVIPVIKLIVLVFSFRIASAVIEPVSDKKFSELLYSSSKILTLLIAIILGIAFLAFVVIMLIIYTCNFGVI